MWRSWILSRADRRRLKRSLKSKNAKRSFSVEPLDARLVLSSASINQGATVATVGSTNKAATTFQFASSVLGYSSQYGSTSWSANQALGGVNVTSYGDSSNAWSASKMNGTTETLTLGFAKALYASGVAVRETYGNGFITKIEVRNAANGAFSSVWAGTDTTSRNKVAVLDALFTQTSYLVDAVRLTINTNANTTWEDIDCVELSGQTSATQTPTPAPAPANKAPTIATAANATILQVSGFDTNLKVLGSDDAGETALKYTWAASSLPAGAAGPTFSVNGSNAAKNTNAVFSKAGTYVLTATITDAGGLTTTSSVTVVVNQTLTKISVTPGTATIATGAKQQFAAQALDQFNNVMSVQPTFTWSANSGTITAAGLYTAPGAAANATITAAANGKNSTAAVTVQGASNYLGMTSALATLTKSLVGDGSISRTDMIQIFASAAADNIVSAAEFNDLKIIVSNASALSMANYVQVLASDVVNGNTANAKYLGSTLGNLQAGSSGTVLNNLVNKWFLGADHPTAVGYSYATVTGSLFVSGAAYTDSKQGYLGDCYFLSALGTIALSNATAITNMIVDNGDNTFTIRFYAGGKADYVTVDKMLPVDSAGRLVYQGVGSLKTAANELWLPLLEKAYAQWNETGKAGRNGTNTYSGIEGGWMSNVYNQVLGLSTQSIFSLDTNAQNAVINALAAKQAVTIGTNSNPGNGLIGGHAYMVVGYNTSTKTFTLFNPWNSTQPGQLTWAQLQSSCTGLSIANPNGTPGATTVMTKVGCEFAGGEVAVVVTDAASVSPAPAKGGSVATSTAGTTLVVVPFSTSAAAIVGESAADTIANDVRSLESDVVDTLAAAIKNRKATIEASLELLDAAYAALENA